MKKIILLSVIVLTALAESKACSCIGFHFCQYIQHAPVKVAVQARVIRSKVYAPDNFAVYLQVLKKYKDEVNCTDTIKVYGNTMESFCYVDVLAHFPVGDTVIVAFGIFNFFATPIDNPDAMTEDYFEVQPILCEMNKLILKNGVVSGAISPGVTTCPLDVFEAGLNNCMFSAVDAPESGRQASPFLVFPNPATDGKIFVAGQSAQGPIEKIRVFHMDGRLIAEYSNLVRDQNGRVEIELYDTGVYVLEILAGGRGYYQKVINL